MSGPEYVEREHCQRVADEFGFDAVSARVVIGALVRERAAARIEGFDLRGYGAALKELQSRHTRLVAAARVLLKELIGVTCSDIRDAASALHAQIAGEP